MLRLCGSALKEWRDSLIQIRQLPLEIRDIVPERLNLLAETRRRCFVWMTIVSDELPRAESEGLA
jgi:hypothetical protein